MSLSVHLFIHLTLSILAGLVVFKIWGNLRISLFFALLGGFLVDFDHLIDYLMAFGWSFNFNYFTNGYQFLKTDKLYIWFHAWEYVIILIVLAIIIKKNRLRAALFSLALGLFFHLGADCMLNEGMRSQAYSLVYRMENSFDLEELVTPEHYIKHLEQKKIINLP